jgi:hypothetical protein
VTRQMVQRAKSIINFVSSLTLSVEFLIDSCYLANLDDRIKNADQ